MRNWNLKRSGLLLKIQKSPKWTGVGLCCTHHCSLRMYHTLDAEWVLDGEWMDSHTANEYPRWVCNPSLCDSGAMLSTVLHCHRAEGSRESLPESMWWQKMAEEIQRENLPSPCSGQRRCHERAGFWQNFEGQILGGRRGKLSLSWVAWETEWLSVNSSASSRLWFFQWSYMDVRVGL